jgi:8-oxo-dGTP pyrophosphatase MutT (NUDIX family)
MTELITRVRSILVTPDGKVLLIRRTRAGRAPYWVLPGGGIEPADTGLESAVTREVMEETGGLPRLHSLIHIAEVPGHGRHAVFLAMIDHWSAVARTGPEFADPANGGYDLDELPLTAETFTERPLRPIATASFIAAALGSGSDLFTLPDLRDSEALGWAVRDPLAPPTGVLPTVAPSSAQQSA